MAKKVETPTTPKIDRKSILDELEKTLDTSQSHAETSAENIIKDIENIERVETPAETLTPETTETPAHETLETPPPAETPTMPPASNMFEDLFNQATEEDLKKNVGRAEHVVSSITDEELDEDDFDPNNESPAVKKATADVEATMIVEGGEMVMSVLCMWIAKDWENFSTNKYVIGQAKKKALKIAIMKMILLKNKKRSPTWSIVGLSIGACVPMFAMALLTLKSKQKQQQDNAALIAQQRALILEQNELAAKEFAIRTAENEAALRENLQNTGTVNPIVLTKREIKKPLVIVKKESRGRHKKDCAYYKGKPCNCKK